MYGFKGFVAEQLFHYSPGTGTQLQHVLGNLFKNEQLHQIYDHFNLKGIIRCGENFDHHAHKHVFVYGLLGFIHQHCSDEVKKQFISQHFIFPNAHLFKPKTRKNDLQAQCNVIAQMIFQKHIELVVAPHIGDTFITTVSIDRYVLATHSSKSYRYSRQKCLKMALKQLADDNLAMAEMKTGYALKRQKVDAELDAKREKIRLDRLALQKEKEAKKMADKRKRNEEYKAKMAEMDARRKQIKATVKKDKESKKGKNTIYRAYSSEEIAAMNPAKRRKLEDLGILAKHK